MPQMIKKVVKPATIDRIDITILGTPKPKQSFKFNSVTGAKFLPQEVMAMEQNYRTQVVTKLPKGFIPFTGGVRIEVLFVFPIPKSMSKKTVRLIEEGGKVYKITKPDLTDNLNKGLMDSIKSIVLLDDSQVCSFSAEKIYGTVPRTELTAIKL